MAQAEIRQIEEKLRKARATKIGSQSVWTRWTTKERKLNWERSGG